MRTRIRIFGLVFSFLFLGLITRLFFWQVLQARDLSRQGQLQYQRSGQILARRGSIFAADGSWLTADENKWTVFIEKDKIKDSAAVIANTIGTYFKDDIDKIQETIEEGNGWVPLVRRVDNDIKKKLEELKIEGMGFDLELARDYPEGSSSAHILGFVGKDDDGENKGYFGLEGFYDLTLKGKPGFTNRESAANGVPIVFGNSKEINATEGIDLITNIDKTAQFTVEKELKKGIEAYGAKEGIVIMMDPKTGAIMAMSSYPSFDPKEYWKYSNDEFRDSAISGTFEPGSIFKPVIMAAALDAGVIKSDTLCDICEGPITIDGYEISTWNNQYRENATMTDVIVNSDNVGMVYIGQKLGAKKTYDYLDKFGIGHLTGVDLQGEVSLQQRDLPWSNIDLATTTFGQGIAMTPMQILRAIGVIANDGEIVTPKIVKEIKSGDWSSEVKIDTKERVVSKKAAEETMEMMVATVKNGESKWASPKGFKIAGKTGTAQIAISGHYDPTKTIASFVGFAPADDPRFVMLVTLKEPQTSEWGSETAAPLWFNIARDLFPYFGIHPEN